MRLLMFFVSYLFSTVCFSVELNILANKNLGLERYLLRFENDNLKQNALLVIGSPDKLTSDTLIVMAHGFHPNPSQYGKVESGLSFRPGDYYRGWVNTYAKAGFNVLVPDYRGHNNSEGITYTHQAGKVEFPERFYASDLIAATNALEKHLSTEFKNIVLIGHSMGSPIAFYAASQIGAISEIRAIRESKAVSQIKNKVKLISLWSSAKYRLPKINVLAKYVIHHAIYDAVTPISNIEFYLQNHKQQLTAKFVYESEQHMLSADDFKLAVSRDIQLIREIENGNH
jgi:pimeloyl-ACP methyl ester carboxylesterase